MNETKCWYLLASYNGQYVHYTLSTNKDESHEKLFDVASKIVDGFDMMFELHKNFEKHLSWRYYNPDERAVPARVNA